MAVRDGRGDVKQTTTGFRGPLMVQSLTSAKSKFLSLINFIYFSKLLNPLRYISLLRWVNRVWRSFVWFTALHYIRYINIGLICPEVARIKQVYSAKINFIWS